MSSLQIGCIYDIIHSYLCFTNYIEIMSQVTKNLSNHHYIICSFLDWGALCKLQITSPLFFESTVMTVITEELNEAPFYALKITDN